MTVWQSKYASGNSIDRDRLAASFMRMDVMAWCREARMWCARQRCEQFAAPIMEDASGTIDF